MQFALFDPRPKPKARPIPRLPRTADELFWAFHQANPEVYLELEKLSLQWFSVGHKHGSMKMFYEYLRYNRGIQTVSEDFKLNNNYHSRYARLLIEKHPELKDFFELRELKS